MVSGQPTAYRYTLTHQLNLKFNYYLNKKTEKGSRQDESMVHL
jgi:hypothetical protein